MVATSSTAETAILLNGSGLVLTTARAPALPPCASKLAPPPSRKAITWVAGSDGSTTAKANSAPPTGRMNVWIVSQIESNQAILSAKNSSSAAVPAAPITHGLASTCSEAKCSGSGSILNFIARPVASTVR